MSRASKPTPTRLPVALAGERRVLGRLPPRRGPSGMRRCFYETYILPGLVTSVVPKDPSAGRLFPRRWRYEGPGTSRARGVSWLAGDPPCEPELTRLSCDLRPRSSRRSRRRPRHGHAPGRSDSPLRPRFVPLSRGSLPLGTGPAKLGTSAPMRQARVQSRGPKKERGGPREGVATEAHLAPRPSTPSPG